MNTLVNLVFCLQYSIFKKPRLLLGASSSTGLTATMGSNFVYNGTGGSEKVDPFAQRAEEEAGASGTTSQPLSKNVNLRLKAGTLRNIKLTK